MRSSENLWKSPVCAAPRDFWVSRGLGFNIVGGVDQQFVLNDSGIYVAKIKENGAAALDGRLQEGDKILAINGHKLENLPHGAAVDLFRNAGEDVQLRVQPKNFWFPVRTASFSKPLKAPRLNSLLLRIEGGRSVPSVQEFSDKPDRPCCSHLDQSERALCAPTNQTHGSVFELCADQSQRSPTSTRCPPIADPELVLHLRLTDVARRKI
ncbi:hypothetical protein MHYP_G00047630 [Metynnis hypsauchen]